MKQRAPPDVWRKRASNWLAITVLAVVLSVLGHYLGERVAEGESMAVRVVLNNLRSQLVIVESTARARLEKDSLAELDGGNPMEWGEEGKAAVAYPIDWEAQTPESYIGACQDRQPGQVGVWCFDALQGADGGVLRYFPRFELNGINQAAYNHRDAYVWRVTLTDEGQLTLEPVGPAQE